MGILLSPASVLGRTRPVRRGICIDSNALWSGSTRDPDGYVIDNRSVQPKCIWHLVHTGLIMSAGAHLGDGGVFRGPGPDPVLGPQSLSSICLNVIYTLPL